MPNRALGAIIEVAGDDHSSVIKKRSMMKWDKKKKKFVKVFQSVDSSLHPSSVVGWSLVRWFGGWVVGWSVITVMF